MIHQVAPHHVAAVRDAIGRPAAVFRHQQQPWSFDTVCRDDVDFGFHASARPRSCVPYKIDLADASIFPNDDIAGDCSVHNLHKSGICRVIQRHGGIVFRLDRTDRNAIRVAGAGATIPIRRGIARSRHAPDRNPGNQLSHSQEPGLGLGQGSLVQGFVDVLIRRRIRNFRHLVLVARRKFDSQICLLVYVRGNAELPLGFAVPEIEVLILDRPVDQLTVLRLHLEIVRHKPQARAEPMRRASGDAIVSACERPRPLLDQIGLLRIGPVAELALGAETQHRRATRIHLIRIAQASFGAVPTKNLGRVGTFRNLGGGRIEAAHILVDVRGNTLARLEDDDVFAAFAEFVCNQRAGKA